MKRTRMLVMTAVIVLGLGSVVYAKLPSNSIMIGSNVYDAAYLNNPTNLANINDQLMNNLGNIYFIKDSKAQDIFTGSPVDDSQLISKVGSTLTYYTATGARQKIVAGADGEYGDPSSVNTNMFAIVNVTYNTITTGLNMYTVKVPQVEGVSNASYFKAGDSAITPLTDMATYIGNNSSGSGILLSIFASDGTTELANGYMRLNEGTSTSGSVNSSVILTATAAQNPLDDTVHGNTAVNLSNTGFAAIDEDNSWIYYENTGDKNKLYRKSVTGVEDEVISNDEVQYINVVGDWVYYSNYSDNGKIYKIRTDGTQRQKISDDMASCINVVGDKIYYINNSDRARIYVQDSQGRRQVLSDSARQLSVGDNFLFYINTSDGNKLYSSNLLNNYSKTKLSDIDTESISAINDYLIFYTGKDGNLYRSMGSATNNPTPLGIITNVPQKGGSTSGLNAVDDKATVICALDDNNIYYTSYADGNKIYKLDSTGNGYKIADAPASYLNVAGDMLYYMNKGKAYVISKDSDGTAKGTAIKKPKLTEKVVDVYQLPSYSTDDISKFNFPERVAAIMSDGTIRQLVVNWDKDNPKIKKGVYNFTGTILGYGTKVTMTVAIDSGSINADNVTVVNEAGKKDSVTVDGTNTKLKPGDIISVYTNMSDTKPVKTAVVDDNYKAVLTGMDFDPDGTTIYVTVTSADKAEGSKVAVPCPAEAPTGFYVNAQEEKITGLKAGKTYKVYIQDENSDGTVPELPSDFTEATANGNGAITVSNIKSKITGPDGKDNKKQMLRIVLEGNVDSKPSDPVEISKAVVPDYVSIDLNYGRIVGSTAGMQYRYKEGEDWKDCQGGSTPISMTLSLQVQVQVKADGPVLESDLVTYGLFPMPVITGIENGKIYSTGLDANDKSTFPDVSWNTDTDTITYTAVLKKKDGTVVDNSVTPSTLLSDLEASGNGDYVLSVTGTKTQVGMDPSTATNTTTVNFTINSSAPSSVDIRFVEKPGTEKDLTANPEQLDTYYQATPQWTDLAGTYSTATLTRMKDAFGDPGSVHYDTIDPPAPVAFVPGNTITQDGEYELAVTTTSRENGAVSVSKKTFRVDPIDEAETPSVGGVYSGGVYTSSVIPTFTDVPPYETEASIMLNGYTTHYVSGNELTVNGAYVLILNTTNTINGHTRETRIPFTISDTSTVSNVIPVDKITVTNNTSGSDIVGIADIPYGATVKVYSSSGSLIGSATQNNSSSDPLDVTINGGIPAGDTKIYVTRTDQGKQESNKTEKPVALVPSIKSISPTTFTETSADDGSISGTGSDGSSTKRVTVEIQNGKIKDSISSSDIAATNLPSGLSCTVTKLDDTHLGITINGNAASNDIPDSISNLTFTIKASGMDAVSGGSTQDVTTDPITINFNGAPAAVTNIAASDIADTGNGSDLKVTFDKAADESKVESYRVIVVKSGHTLDLEQANSLSASKYTEVPKTGSNLEVTLNASARDSDGGLIASGDYYVYVLSVADGTNANLNKLSSPVSVNLTTP
ncbi:DUF5050 domain-containing protein [Clostridium sp. LBM24168]